MENQGRSVKSGKQSKNMKEKIEDLTLTKQTQGNCWNADKTIWHKSAGENTGANEGASQMGSTQTQETIHSTIKKKTGQMQHFSLSFLQNFLQNFVTKCQSRKNK